MSALHVWSLSIGLATILSGCGAGQNSNSNDWNDLSLQQNVGSVGRSITYYVDPSGSDAGTCTSAGVGACKTIQGAILRLPTNLTGDFSIVVANATFSSFEISNFHLTQRSSLTIRAGATNFTVNGGGSKDFGVLIASNSGTGSIRIQGALFTNNSKAGVYVSNSEAPLTLEQVSADGNIGHGMVFENNASVMFLGNIAANTNGGAGVTIQNNSAVVQTAGTLSANANTGGSGIRVLDNSAFKYVSAVAGATVSASGNTTAAGTYGLEVDQQSNAYIYAQFITLGTASSRNRVGAISISNSSRAYLYAPGAGGLTGRSAQGNFVVRVDGGSFFEATNGDFQGVIAGGVLCTGQSQCTLNGVRSSTNGGAGIRVEKMSTMYINGSPFIESNTGNGMEIYDMSRVYVTASMQVQNNTGYEFYLYNGSELYHNGCSVCNSTSYVRYDSAIINSAGTPIPGVMYDYTTSLHAIHAVAATINSATETVVKYETETTGSDQSNEHNPTTGTFTAISGGLYQISASLSYVSANWGTGKVCELRLYAGSAASMTKRASIRTGPSGTSYCGMGISATLNLRPGDQVQLRTFHNQGAAVKTIGDGALTIARIR